VELMLVPSGEFYFLEMNTRLQVEHPVTELVTGLDLVAWQLAVAGGARLPLTQADVSMQGHAIEARLYAEDPAQGFLPQTGRVLCWRPAAGDGIRVDGGIAEGQEVGSFYDPLLAKIIAHGETREIARRRLVRAVEWSVLLGVVNNRQFLARLLRDERFISGAVTTSTVDAMVEQGELCPQDRAPDPASWVLAGVLCSRPRPGGRTDPWRSRGEAAWPVTLESGSESRTLRVSQQDDAGYRVEDEQGENERRVTLISLERSDVRFDLDGVRRSAHFAWDGDLLHLELAGQSALFSEPAIDDRAGEARASSDGRLTAPIGGQVIAVSVGEGDTVTEGQCLVVLVAMKMEHRVVARAAGRVERVSVAVGDQVAARQVLVTIAIEEEPSEEE
jgi:geranyl-CoA carboxylase alpha subunit